MNKRIRKKFIKSGRRLPNKYIALVVKGNPSSIIFLKYRYSDEIGMKFNSRKSYEEVIVQAMMDNNIEGKLEISYIDKSKLTVISEKILVRNKDTE